MTTKVIAFIGIDKFDFMHYISRIIHHMGKRVLLVDISENKALKASIPIPESFELSEIDYRGVGFTTNIEEQIMEGYEYILIDFGFNINHDYIEKCDQIIMVSNLELNHVEALAKLEINENKTTLVIRDTIPYKVDSVYVKKQMNQHEQIQYVYELEYDSIDYKERLNCFYTNRIKFKHCTKYMRHLVHRLTQDIMDLNNTSEKSNLKAYKKAYKKAKKGL